VLNAKGANAVFVQKENTVPYLSLITCNHLHQPDPNISLSSHLFL
jgi:hypothetical protein